jgi:c-di-GMP-related signal transduction protein
VKLHIIVKKHIVWRYTMTTWLVSIISFLIMNLFQIGLLFSLPINHLYSHKPYTTVQRRHKYTYNKYRIDINIIPYFLSENISLPSQNMKFVDEWAKRTSYKLHILSSRLIFFSINHIHIHMTCLSQIQKLVQVGKC